MRHFVENMSAATKINRNFKLKIIFSIIFITSSHSITLNNLQSTVQLYSCLIHPSLREHPVFSALVSSFTEATTRNTSAVRRLNSSMTWLTRAFDSSRFDLEIYALQNSTAKYLRSTYL